MMSPNGTLPNRWTVYHSSVPRAIPDTFSHVPSRTLHPTDRNLTLTPDALVRISREFIRRLQQDHAIPVLTAERTQTLPRFREIDSNSL
jgi:hypothetical protein